MDSRHWQRRLMPLEVEVRLWRRSGEQVITCQTRDVSMSGAFLSTEELGYPKHRLLDIRFLYRAGQTRPEATTYLCSCNP